MDGVLVWLLAVVMTAGCVLHGRYVLRYQDESFWVNFLYLFRGMFAGGIATCYWLQIVGWAEPDEVVPVVRGIGIPASFIAYVLPVMLKPRGRVMADGIVEAIRGKLER